MVPLWLQHACELFYLCSDFSISETVFARVGSTLAAFLPVSEFVWALLLQPSYPCQSLCGLYSCSLPTHVRVRVGSTLAAFLPDSSMSEAIPSCHDTINHGKYGLRWKTFQERLQTMAPEIGMVFVAEGLLEVWYIGNCKQSLEPGKLSTFFLASCCSSTFSHITSPRLFFFFVVYATTSWGGAWEWGHSFLNPPSCMDD